MATTHKNNSTNHIDNITTTETKRRRAPAAERGRERVLGAAPSNTAPYNTIIVNHRVDSLYLSYSGTLKPEMRDQLEELKQRAASFSRKESSYAQIQLNGVLFKVHDKGRGKFKYVISNNELHIQISNSRMTSTLPLAVVQVRSEYLYQKEIHEITAEIERLLSIVGLLDGSAKVSRCDLCCDLVTDYPSLAICDRRYVTRSKKFTGYWDGDAITGIDYGMGGDIGFRLYDKTREIKLISHKYFFYNIWKPKGWDGEQTVWRCEFELKRPVLRSMNINSTSDLSDKISALWAYCTREWLWLPVRVKGDHHSDRWPTHPFWKVVQTALNDYDGTLLIRKYNYGHQLNKNSMFKSYRSALTHYMALEFMDNPEVAHQMMLSACRTHYNSQGYQKTFENDIAERVADKRRQHNYKLNSSTSMTDVWK